MSSISDAKALARRLRAELVGDIPTLNHSRSLELVARGLGYKNWNTFCVSEESGPPVIPILRTFPGPEAARFYLGFLGFNVDWEHRFETNMPLYQQVSRDGAVLHLSEHHGDATPGSAVRIRIPDVAVLQRELAASTIYPLRIGLTHQDWADELSIPDPFGNTLTFHTPKI